MAFKSFPLVLLVLFASFCAHAWTLDMPVLWRTDLATLLESTALASDINGDGLDEIIAAGREEMFALSGTGAVLWHWRTKGRFMTPPAVYHSADGKAWIYAADNLGQFTCLDGAGQVVWQATLKGPSVWSGPVVGTLEPGGKPVVVQTDGTGLVWCFDQATGRVLWSTQIKGASVTPAMADIDGDGRSEIVVTTDLGFLFALRSDGSILWSSETKVCKPLWAASSPVVFTATDGKARIVAAYTDDTVGCLDGTGKLVWSRPAKGGVDSSISVCDFDDDGKCDVFLATQLGVIYRYTEDGELRWEIDMQGRSLAPGAIIDIDNDGRLEYVLCTQNGRLMVLDQAGQFLYEMQFPHRTIGTTPAFGRFTKDSTTFQVAIPGGEAGILTCLDTPALRTTRAEWPSYRRDTCNTGFWARNTQTKPTPMTPANLAPEKLLAGEDIVFSVQMDQAPAAPLKAEAVCITPDGSRRASVSRVLGIRGELRLSVDFAQLGLYRFSWSLAQPDDTPICSGARDIMVTPREKENALARAAIEALWTSAKGLDAALPHAAAALRSEADTVQETLANAEQASAHQDETGAPASGATKHWGTVVERARRAAKIAALFRDAAALPAGSSLIPFQGLTWESRAVDLQLPDKPAANLKIVRRIVPGEHDAVSVLLLNITDTELQVRLTDNPLPGETVRATLLHSRPVPTSLGEVSWDPLPELDESRTISIPPLRCREVWLDVDATQAAPGRHTLLVVAQALNGPAVLDAPPSPQTVAPAETKIEVEYNILPFTMAPPGDFRLCAWAHLEEKGGEWQDLLAHGNNVFITPLPEARRDASQKLAEPNCAKLDAVLDILKGWDVMLLLSGMPALQGEVGSDQYVAELKTYLDALARHMAEKGLDARHFALYPFDEPGGAGWNTVNSYVAFGKAVRAANPEILIYQDGGCELPMCEVMKPVTDIWTPGIYQLPEKSEVMDTIRGSGKTLWSYNCGYGYSRPTGPNLKNINVVAEYRNAALFALNYGATGIGFWSYNIGGDQWTRVDMEYTMVYPGAVKPIASRRWKAVREGIEDARIFMALRKAAPNDRVRKLAGETLPALMNQSFEEMRLGLARYILDATNNDETVNMLREELMNCAELPAEK